MSALKRLFGRRKLAVLIGVALLPLAGIALAAVIVSMTTSVTSMTYAGEGLGLALINTSDPFDCTSATYTDSVNLTAPNFDLSASSGQDVGQNLCIKNDGFVDMNLLTVAAAVTSSSDPQCSPSEAAAENGGAGCTGVGELQDVVQFDFSFAGSTTPNSCISTSVSDGTIGALASGFFDTGTECLFDVTLSLQAGATEQEKTAASTDTAQFTLSVEGTTPGS